ncbi:MAG: SAM-dependent methyltransferase [Pseudomonadota bacterium]
MPVQDFMALCLGHEAHGYYRTRDPLGAAGDFITAPEISQMFGELIGLWLAAVWQASGAPARFVLAELGPGRGTLMADALRAADRVPGFVAAAQIWLVETSAPLRARQAKALAGRGARWAERAEDLPAGPLFCVANEFFDALPIRQAVRAGGRWRERCVGLDGGRMVFGLGRVLPLDLNAPDGTVKEESPASTALIGALAGRIAEEGGALLALDYGAEAPRAGGGDTLQALRAQAPEDPLARPGEADLTAHVDFAALSAAARRAGCSTALTPQGAFLERLGLTERALALARAAGAAAGAEAVAAAHRRLAHPEEMGTLFKALAVWPAGGARPPGLE